MKLSTTDELDRISGERRPGNSTLPPKLLLGAGGGNILKAKGPKCCGRGSRPCNREGARGA